MSGSAVLEKNDRNFYFFQKWRHNRVAESLVSYESGSKSLLLPIPRRITGPVVSASCSPFSAVQKAPIPGIQVILPQ